MVTGQNPQRLGNGHPNIVPYQTFATQDGSIILAIGNNRQFQKFCQLAKCNELAEDPLYGTNENRVINRATLIPLLATILAGRSSHFWVEQLEQVKVPCGPVNSLEQVFAHPQIQHRQMVREVTDNDGNKIKTVASPINLSATPLQYNSASPDLGQHSKQILAEVLNYSDTDISDLFKRNIIS